MEPGGNLLKEVIVTIFLILNANAAFYAGAPPFHLDRQLYAQNSPRPFFAPSSGL
jgi:hypothetical protein